MTADPVAWLVAGAAVVLVVGTLAAPGTVAVACEGLRLARGAAATLRDPGLDDAAKEREARRLSLALFGVGGRLVGRVALAVAVAAALVAGARAAGLVAPGAVTGLLADWPGIAFAVLLGTLLFARTAR